MRINPMFKFLTWIVLVAFMYTGMALAYPISRIMPTGKVMAYRDGELIQVLQAEAPLPVGTKLRTEGRCAVRFNDFYFVAENGSVFSVDKSAGTSQLTIEDGVLFFAASSATGPLVFNTPSGAINTAKISIPESNASGMLKGFVDVSSSATKMGVVEGGSLVVSTSKGQTSINSGRQIVVAKAPPELPLDETLRQSGMPEDQPTAVPQGKSEEKKEKIPAGYFVAGGLGVAALAALLFINNDGSDSSGQQNVAPQGPAPVSPASP